MRNVVYFGGAALAVPLAVLAGRALLGLVLLVLLVLPARRPSAEPEAPRHPVTASGI
ncbi:hypothetical protein [Sphaerisporangium sp. NPDC051011]|uniref:hypothetical protein n=1 Tax=Sphaerisporangium sp. NPDC051011 TaxID=3155792 RepID=UPI00340A09EE